MANLLGKAIAYAVALTFLGGLVALAFGAAGFGVVVGYELGLRYLGGR